MRNILLAASLAAATAACTANVDITSEDQNATPGTSISTPEPYLSGCHGHASSTIPSDGRYDMTTFGGGADNQPMSCGGYADGTGWYAADRQRYGCGAHLQVEANGNCVVVEAQDYGPDQCVETAAHSPVLDMSPRAAKVLYGVSSAGWSDHLAITVTEVDASTPLGLCQATGGGGGGGGGGGTTGASCSSSTLGRDVDDGTCVQSASDSAWYQCQSGSWVATTASNASCTASYGFCSSATLGKDVPAGTCVQSASSSNWFQCNGQGWVTPVDTSTQTGPIGACSSWNPL